MKTLVPVKLNLERVSSLQLAAARVKRRLQTRAVLALTLTAEQIEIALLRGTPEGVATPVKLPPIVLSIEDVYRHPERAGAALMAALEAAGTREKRCAVSVPPGWALTATVELPAVSVEDLRGYLEIRAEREFSLPLSEMRLGYSAYTLPDGKTRATLAALPAKRLEAVETMLAAAGGRRAASVALALDACYSDEEEPTRLHLLADGGHVDVVVTAGVLVAGQGVAALRTLPGPSGKDEAKALTENGEEAAEETAVGGLALAHAAGTNGASFDPAAFCREVRITLGRLPTEVQSRVKAARFHGNAVAARRLCEETREGLRRMGIGVPTGCEPDGREVPPTCALRYLRREAVPFEFVVPVPNRWEEGLRRVNTPRGRKVAAGVLAAVLLPLLAFFARGQQESSLQREWEQMRGNVAELDLIQQKVRTFRPWFNRLPVRLELLEGLFAAFPEGGDVWAKSIGIKGDVVSVTAFANSEEARLAMMKRLGGQAGVSAVKTVQVRGVKPVQFTFTYQWGVANRER